MTDELKRASRGVETSVKSGIAQSESVDRTPTRSAITADVGEDGDVFVSIRQRANRPANDQLTMLAAAVGAAVDHASGSQATDAEGEFIASPEGSVTVVLAGDRFLRCDVADPDEWADLSWSRLLTRVSGSMEQV